MPPTDTRTDLATCRAVLEVVEDLVARRMRAGIELASLADFERRFELLWTMMAAGLDHGGMRPFAAELRRRLTGQTVPVSIGPHAIRVDLGDGIARLGAMGRSRERALARLLARLVAPGDVVVEIGAHTGFHTALLARCVAPHGRVIAFEPSPANVPWLERALAINEGLADVRVEAQAVSDAPGIAVMYSYGHESDADASYAEDSGELLSLIRSERTGGQAHEVSVETLDRYCARSSIATVDLVKIDTEGAELHVLAGAREVLARNPHAAVLVELHPTVLLAEGGSADEVLGVLRAGGRSLHDPWAEMTRVERFADLTGTTVLATAKAPA